MDEKEIQATMARLLDAWSKDSKAGATIEAFKRASDALCKFTRLVEAVEVIASCQIDVAEAITDGDSTSLETAHTEGSC
jgi:hypothetical protein